MLYSISRDLNATVRIGKLHFEQGLRFFYEAHKWRVSTCPCRYTPRGTGAIDIGWAIDACLRLKRNIKLQQYLWSACHVKMGGDGDGRGGGRRRVVCSTQGGVFADVLPITYEIRDACPEAITLMRDSCSQSPAETSASSYSFIAMLFPRVHCEQIGLFTQGCRNADPHLGLQAPMDPATLAAQRVGRVQERLQLPGKLLC